MRNVKEIKRIFMRHNWHNMLLAVFHFSAYRKTVLKKRRMNMNMNVEQHHIFNMENTKDNG